MVLKWYIFLFFSSFISPYSSFTAIIMVKIIIATKLQ